MIIYEGNFYFLVPRGFSSSDMEFNIYDFKGDFIGTNLTGINKNVSFSKEERYKLEELVEEYSTDFEIKMKFFKEFKVDITEWKKLNLCTESIIACMDRAWNITRFYLEKYLLN